MVPTSWSAHKGKNMPSTSLDLTHVYSGGRTVIKAALRPISFTGLNQTFIMSWKRCTTWLAPLLVPICRLMVVLSNGAWMWALGSNKCLRVPYALIPAWLAHLLVPICKRSNIICECLQKNRKKKNQQHKQLKSLSSPSCWFPFTSVMQTKLSTHFPEYLSLLSLTPTPSSISAFQQWNLLSWRK